MREHRETATLNWVFDFAPETQTPIFASMDAKFIIRAQQQLDEAIASIEKAYSKRVTPAARIMLQAILVEALTTRESEWRNRGQIMLEAYGSEEQMGRKINESFSTVLRQAYMEQSGDFITTRDVLAAIQNKWCGIFPIC